MKKNRLMALTALLTLLGAPSSKAQEVKDDSKQPTSSQSASKDSKATDKTKEQVKNQGQNKDSKTVDKTKEQTKDSNKDGKKEQDKGSKKDDKKQQTKNSNPTDSKKVLENRMTPLGYTWEQIKNKWPWLLTLGLTNVASGIGGNARGKKVNVDAKVNEKVQQTIQQKIANNELVKAADIETRAQELAGDKKYTDADLANEKFLSEHGLITQQQSNVLVFNASKLVTDDFNQKIGNGELVKANDQNAVKKAAAAFDMIDKNDKNAVTQAAENFGIKYTEESLKTEAEKLAGDKKYTEQELSNKVSEATKHLEENISKLKDEFKYTEDAHRKGIINALDQAYKFGTICEMKDVNKKKEFDENVPKDKQLADSLKLIQNKLNQNFADILVKTTYGKFDADKEKTLIKADQMVGAFVMLSDIKNALVNGMIGKDLTATIKNSSGKNDAAWSKFEFKINSKSYVVFLNQYNNEKFYVSNDDKKTEYLISLK